MKLHRIASLALTLWLVLPAMALAEPAMWVIRNGQSTVYLIGTIHLLKHQTEWNSTKVQKALAESGKLWLEIGDPDNEAAVAPLIQRFGIDRAKPLSQKLNFVQKAKLAKAAAEYELPVQNLEPLQPWAAGIMFTTLPLQKAGYDPKDGVDLFLKKEADKKGKTVKGFETLEEQVHFLADLPEADQIAFFEDSLDDVEKGIAMFEKIATAWLQGDTKTIGDLLVSEMKEKYAALYQKLVVQRNIRWAEKISALVKEPGVQLVAVGAGHLVGPDSVEVQLARRGIKAEPY